MPDVIKQIDELILEGARLRDAWRDEFPPSDAQRQERASRTARWSENCKHILRFAGLTDLVTTFCETTENRAYPAYRFAQLKGIMESARDTVAGGFLGRLAHLLHADLFDSVIDQADELLGAGHTTPAAVLGRIVIETWLRDEADRAGIALAGNEKASAINEMLKRQGRFSTPRWRLLQGFLDVGNAAAHGDTDAFKPEDVQQMLQFARANCL